MNSHTCVLLFDGFSDVEMATWVSQIRGQGTSVSLVSVTGKQVRSAAGIIVLPDISLSQLNSRPARLIVPDSFGNGRKWFRIEPRLQKLMREVRNEHGEIIASRGLLAEFTEPLG